jgi:tetratricopeptide (TPR) repeat protein
MPSKDLPDQDTAVTEAKASGWMGLPIKTVRRFVAWTKAHRLKAMLAIGGVASFLVTAIIVSWLLIAARQHRLHDKLVTMDQVLQALDSRELSEVQTLAKQMQEQGTLSAEDLGGPAFALGAGAAYEAENSSGNGRVKLFLLAARYLEEANNRGFPANRSAEGLYLLGKSLYESGQFLASRPILLSALKISPQHQAEIHTLLANAYMNDARPKLELALEQNSMLLADKKLSEAKQQEALLQRAQILLGLGKIYQCNATLDQISDGAKNPAVAIERGRALMSEAQALRKKTPSTDDDQQKAREKQQEAIQTLRPAITQDTNGGKAARQAMYLTGMCYLELGESQAALDQFMRTYNFSPDTPEGAAAGFQAAELNRRQGRDLDALAEYRRVLGSITDPESYTNPWIPLDRLKSNILAAYQHYLNVQKFEIALQFTRMMKPLFPSDQVLLLQAETHGVWGQALINQSGKGSLNKTGSIRRLGREQFRRAGDCYAKLAKLLPANKKFTDQVWNSATSFLQGQDFNNAARMFQEYLKNEVQRRHPQALAYLGESLLAIDQLDKALEMLKECIDLYPRDVAACQARLLASRAYEEKGDWRNAESLLLDNLNGDYLTPESKEWRDSLFVLGELLHAEGRYAEAAHRLDEAAKRYPDLPETIQARYLMANCYYKMAAATQDKLNKDPTGNASAMPAKQVQDLYSKALEQYKQVQETLAKVRDNAELTAVQKAILRNCYFAIGNILFDQGDYEAAVKAYSTAANRYQSYPEVLNAYVQIANAYRNLNKPRDARIILQQAMFTLNRMKPDEAFEKTTNYNRKQWADRLDLLSSL